MVGLTVAAMATLTASEGATCLQPEAEFQLDGETVPSSVEGALYRNCENVEANEPPTFALYEQDSEASIPVDVQHLRAGLYEVSFEESLTAETTYQFEATPECVGLGPEESGKWTFQTSAATDVPDDIGIWTSSRAVVGPIRYPDTDVCTREATASYVRFEFEPTEDAEQWGQAIAFETLVNQEVWEPQLGVGETVPAGASRVGWGEEQIYAVCDDEKPESTPYAETLHDESHGVGFVARLPGTDIRWEVDPEHIFLNCPTNPDEDTGDDGDDGDDDSDGDGTEHSHDEDTGDIDADEPACNQGGTVPTAIAAVIFLLIAATRRYQGATNSPVGGPSRS